MDFVSGAWQLVICYRPVVVDVHACVFVGESADWLTHRCTRAFILSFKDLVQVYAGVMGGGKT